MTLKVHSRGHPHIHELLLTDVGFRDLPHIHELLLKLDVGFRDLPHIHELLLALDVGTKNSDLQQQSYYHRYHE